MVDVCILLAIRQPDQTDGHLVALDSIRFCRRGFGGTAGDWDRRRAAATSAAVGSHQEHCGTRGAWGDDWTYRFTAAGALGDRGPGCAGISNIIVACRPLSAGFRRGGCIHSFHDGCFDRDLRAWSFWRD